MPKFISISLQISCQTFLASLLSRRSCFSAQRSTRKLCSSFVHLSQFAFTFPFPLIAASSRLLLGLHLCLLCLLCNDLFYFVGWQLACLKYRSILKASMCFVESSTALGISSCSLVQQTLGTVSVVFCSLL